jgi:hypothetical protein
VFGVWKWGSSHITQVVYHKCTPTGEEGGADDRASTSMTEGERHGSPLSMTAPGDSHSPSVSKKQIYLYVYTEISFIFVSFVPSRCLSDWPNNERGPVVAASSHSPSAQYSSVGENKKRRYTYCFFLCSTHHYGYKELPDAGEMSYWVAAGSKGKGGAPASTGAG